MLHEVLRKGSKRFTHQIGWYSSLSHPPLYPSLPPIHPSVVASDGRARELAQGLAHFNALISLPGMHIISQISNYCDVFSASLIKIAIYVGMYVAGLGEMGYSVAELVDYRPEAPRTRRIPIPGSTEGTFIVSCYAVQRPMGGDPLYWPCVGTGVPTPLHVFNYAFGLSNDHSNHFTTLLAQSKGPPHHHHHYHHAPSPLSAMPISWRSGGGWREEWPPYSPMRSLALAQPLCPNLILGRWC